MVSRAPPEARDLQDQDLHLAQEGPGLLVEAVQIIMLALPLLGL